ncbi:hypothetical protein AGMMS49992_28020 [Clostridia bacterium]|nr:hypothetical protein AGMMS49992_28020 [Clostridia bacterium]
MIIMSFVVLSFTKQYPSDLTLTLTHVKKTIGMNGSKYLMNSLIISLFVAVLGTSFSFFIAIYSTRINTVLSKLLHVICIVSIAIPGIVLGLAYVFFFKGSILYGTFVLLVLVNITHFIASPYIMMVNTLRKINENIEIVGETLGVGRFRIIRDVLIPQTKSTLIEMVSYLFVNSMITISAISFLATTVNKPFSLMINQFEQLMIIECSAVVSILLLVTNGFIKIATFAIKKRLQEKDDKYVPNEITV